MGQIWLRAEYKSLEKRTPLMPVHAGQLIRLGHEVIVEKCTQRIFSNQLYQDAGCELVEPGDWYQAPNHAYILGLKQLDDSQRPLRHKHIYFAHSFKDQPEASILLNRFRSGGGILYDLEYLIDEHHQRIASFGFYAGLVGAAIGLLAWCHQQLHPKKIFKIPHQYPNEMLMLAELKKQMARIKEKPTILIVGANGRCGLGAQCLLKEFNLNTTQWSRIHTQSENRNADLFSKEIILNCISVDSKTPALFNACQKNHIQQKKLSLIVDVSCDAGSPYNPLPYYKQASDFDSPIQMISIFDHPIQLIAIDHLPAWLPLESSIHFSNQLFPYLNQILLNDTPWQRSEYQFQKQIQRVLQIHTQEKFHDTTPKSIHYLNRECIF